MKPRLPRPLIIAHRGYSERYPENTLLAFQKAVGAGADMIEMDVRLSRDQRVVVCHDSSLRRLFGAKGKIAKLTLAMIQKRSGGAVPLLADVLNALRGKTRFYVEVKTERLGRKARDLLVENVWETLRAGGVSKDCLVASFDYRVAQKVRGLDAKAWCGFICARARALRIARVHRFAHVNAVCPHRQLLTSRLVHALKDKGLQLFPWVLDTPAQRAQALALGVDGIVTNNPATLARWLDKA